MRRSAIQATSGRGARLAGSLFVLTAVLGLATAQTPPAGYRDDFSGPIRGWATGGTYKVTQADGVLTLDVHRETKWAGESLDLGGVYDLSAHPYVNVRAKADTPCILHVYLNDGQ